MNTIASKVWSSIIAWQTGRDATDGYNREKYAQVRQSSAQCNYAHETWAQSSRDSSHIQRNIPRLWS